MFLRTLFFINVYAIFYLILIKTANCFQCVPTYIVGLAYCWFSILNNSFICIKRILIIC